MIAGTLQAQRDEVLAQRDCLIALFVHLLEQAQDPSLGDRN